MVSVPNPRTWADEFTPTYADLKLEVRDTLQWLLQPPMAKVRADVAESIPNNTYFPIDFNVDDVDPYNWHSTTVNKSRITPTIPGWYRGWMSLSYEGNTVGNYRLCVLAKNSVRTRSRKDARPPDVAGQSKSLRGVPFLVSCNGTTDYLQMYAYQDSGVALNTVVNTHLQPEFFIRWWGPL